MVALRPGIDLGDGSPMLAIGDVATVAAATAIALVSNGACEFFVEEKPDA